jgi:hypothetical protein
MLTDARLGIGIGDLQQAAAAEARRIMDEAKGDRSRASVLILQRLHERGLVNEQDVKRLTGVAERGFAASSGQTHPAVAYKHARDTLNEMLADPDSSPVALALAGAAAGSYTPEVSGEGDGTTVVMAKKGKNWQDTLTGAGAVIGGVLGGSDGALLGATIGGVVGKVVDECID